MSKFINNDLAPKDLVIFICCNIKDELIDGKMAYISFGNLYSSINTFSNGGFDGFRKHYIYKANQGCKKDTWQNIKMGEANHGTYEKLIEYIFTEYHDIYEMMTIVPYDLKNCKIPRSVFGKHMGKNCKDSKYFSIGEEDCFICKRSNISGLDSQLKTDILSAGKKIIEYNGGSIDG